MSVDITPWDKIEAFGNPWHGRMDSNGTLTIESGASFGGQKPKQTYPGVPESDDSSRQHVLVKFQGLPDAPSVTQFEAESGMEWRNTAFLVGTDRHYSPFANIGLGANSWLYRCTDGEVWAFQPIRHTVTLLRIMAKRINVPNDGWQVALEYLMPSGTIPAFPKTYPSPNGSQSVIPIIAGTPAIAYVTISVSGGGATTLPAVTAAKTMGTTRAETDNGGGLTSAETFRGVRWLANGQKVEIWSGMEFLALGGVRHWFWIGSTKRDIYQAVFSSPGGIDRWDVTFDGDSFGWNVSGIDQAPAYQFNLTDYCGVLSSCYLPSPGPNQYKSVWRGIAGQVRRYTSSTGADDKSIVENPLTGAIVDTRWLF